MCARCCDVGVKLAVERFEVRQLILDAEVIPLPRKCETTTPCGREESGRCGLGRSLPGNPSPIALRRERMHHEISTAAGFFGHPANEG
jgi:hypothetical protein